MALKVKKTKTIQQVGEWAFIVGVILAILVGLVQIPQIPVETVATVLIVLGILVGIINISEKNAHDFLLATIALLATSSAGFAGIQSLPVIGGYLGPILANIAAFVAPAAVIVALKAVYELGK
ncbi:hypothetical protein EPN87_01460 [archaeon]|nr:MAG: hypothetical protein EPN87_01460 [archaeon]